VFDSSVVGKLWSPAGVGVWQTTLPGGFTSASTITWTSQNTGLENLDTNEIISPPGGSPVGIAWDRPTFYIANTDTYATSWGPNENNAVIRGASGDYASNNPSYIVVLADNAGGPEESSYSTNGGRTWTNFASYPSTNPVSTYNGDGGSIAAASSTDIVWYPANGFQPSYTLDGGNTWNLVTLPGSPTWGGGYNYYMDMRWITADRVNIGTFYMYDPGAGIYKSTNGGVTWTQVYSGTPGSNEGVVNNELEAVPGEAGNLFFTGGPVSTSTDETFVASTNGGSNWSAVSNVKNVSTFGFGAPATYGGYPSIYIVGYVGGVYGIWRSTNDASSWTQVGEWPLNSIDDIAAISGDMNTYGRIYVGFTGTGFEYGDTSDAAPSVLFTAPTIGSAVSGSSVTLSATSSGSVAILGVQFQVDGTNIGSAIGSPPYTTTWNSTGVSDGDHTLSVIAYGTSGNDATSSMPIEVGNSPPSTPTGLMATASSTSEVDLSWTAATDTISVAGYQVFRNGTQVASSTETSYADTGLNADTAYTYIVKAYDNADNISASSTSATATTSAGALWTATAAPAIQDLSGASTATFSNVNIGTAWSDRMVVVGVANNSCCTNPITSLTINGISATEATTTTSYADSIWYASVPTSTSATIILNTSGHISQWGIQVGQLTGASSSPYATAVHDSNYVADPQTVTAVVPTRGVGVVFAATVSNVTTPEVPVWTNAVGDSYSHDETGNTMQAILAHTTTAGSDTPSLSSASASTYGNSGSAMAMVTWGPTTNNGPTFDNIASAATSTSAVITWITNEAASSEVVVGTTTSYGSASSSASLVTSHSISISGLTASTSYHFAVVSTDGSGYTSTSTDQTFTTTEAEPIISSISSGSPTTTSATITWTTDEAANSEVVFGTTTSYGSASSSASLVTSHSITLSGLATSTAYHFAVVSTDGSNKTSTSTDQTFTTATVLDSATTAWVDAVVTAGGSVSTTQQNYVNTLIVGLKNDGVWSSLDRLWLYAGESSPQQAEIDLRNLATSTIHGTLTLAAGGYTGDGSTGYIDTGFNPTTADGNFSANAGSIGVYDRTNNTSDNYGNTSMGQYNGSHITDIYPWTGAPQVNYDVNDSNFNSYHGAGDTTTQGFWLVNLASSVVYLDRNGSNLATSSAGSTGLINNDMYVFSLDSSGSPSGFLPDQLAASFIGGGLTSAQRTDLSSLLDAYMTAWGVNVY
jgi:hypothetical protein